MTDFLLPALALFGAGLGAYGAIRADLAKTHELAKLAHESAANAHKRIDHLQRRQS